MSSESATSERKARVLEAAAEHLRSADVEWAKALTYDLLAEMTGIDKSVISADFGPKRRMMAELVSYCLNPRVDQAAYVEEVTALGNDLLSDDDLSFEDIARTVGNIAFNNLRETRRLHTEMAFWSLASEDPLVREELRRMYNFYDEASLAMYQSVVERFQLVGVAPRAGFSGEQLVAVLDAVTEGLAVRATIDPELIPEELNGTVMVALFEALFPADGRGEAIGDRLAELPAAPAD